LVQGFGFSITPILHYSITPVMAHGDPFGMSSFQKSDRRSYHLARGIRLRRERFGLLFYNPKGPKLVFVHSGALIQPEFFSGKIHLKKWIQNRFPTLSEEKILKAEERLSPVLSKLVEQGLIIEALEDS
jgi:putative mycofactocin binding protein MftB